MRTHEIMKNGGHVIIKIVGRHRIMENGGEWNNGKMMGIKDEHKIEQGKWNNEQEEDIDLMIA